MNNDLIHCILSHLSISELVDIATVSVGFYKVASHVFCNRKMKKGLQVFSSARETFKKYGTNDHQTFNLLVHIHSNLLPTFKEAFHQLSWNRCALNGLIISDLGDFVKQLASIWDYDCYSYGSQKYFDSRCFCDFYQIVYIDYMLDSPWHVLICSKHRNILIVCVDAWYRSLAMLTKKIIKLNK